MISWVFFFFSQNPGTRYSLICFAKEKIKAWRGDLPEQPGPESPVLVHSGEDSHCCHRNDF